MSRARGGVPQACHDVMCQGQLPPPRATIMPGELIDGYLGEDDLPAAPVRRFTWHELSALNRRSNAHVAYKGKV